MSEKPKNRPDTSDASAGTETRQRRLRPSGGYRALRSFHASTVIYDGTVLFCDRFVDKRSRTHDQMVQAARSGRQNIAEGSRAAATSSQTELRLINVARASLDELLLDYEDFLRHRGMRQWKKDDPEARAVRAVGLRREPRDDPADPSDLWKDYSRWLEDPDPAVVANALICLIHQANYLLDQQIAALERDFIREGGYSEQLAAARLEERGRQKGSPSAPSDGAEKAPACPACGKLMVLRTARQGKQSGSRFWGCSAYPDCRGTRALGGSDDSDQSAGSESKGRR
jgi:four helix bundle suffix protein